MASIIVTSGTNKGDYYPLGQRTTIIGRDEAITIQVIDRKISRKHMKIRFDNGSYYAVDMDSKHGVFINGIQIDKEMVLSDNDYILIGQTILLFTTEDFDDRENAMYHFKKVGERQRPTITDSGFRVPKKKE
jgi:pSer/pThr/pTyr-binding forkhead associated (FHA) protein